MSQWRVCTTRYFLWVRRRWGEDGSRCHCRQRVTIVYAKHLLPNLFHCLMISYTTAKNQKKQQKSGNIQKPINQKTKKPTKIPQPPKTNKPKNHYTLVFWFFVFWRLQDFGWFLGFLVYWFLEVSVVFPLSLLCLSLLSYAFPQCSYAFL